MKIIQAIEFEYYAIRAINSQDGDFGGRLFATSGVAAQLSPVLFSLLVKYGLFGNELRLAMAFFASFIIMYLLTDKRRDQITASYGQQFAQFQMRAKLSLAAFFTVSTLITSIIAGVSPILALGAFLVFALMPLQRWVKPIAQ